MSIRKNKNFVRVEVNIPVELKEKLLNYSKIMGLNLTSSVILLLKNSLEK